MHPAATPNPTATPNTAATRVNDFMAGPPARVRVRAAEHCSLIRAEINPSFPSWRSGLRIIPGLKKPFQIQPPI
jgi:hypothetical protein